MFLFSCFSYGVRTTFLHPLFFSRGTVSKNSKGMAFPRKSSLHKDDFGIDATWVFFATSHGKSPCDGIGGIVKTNDTFQLQFADQILDVSSIRAFCKTNIPGIQFCYISKKRMEVRLQLKKDLLWVRLYQEQQVTISSK